MPKISVVFTSYNHREYLEEALEGIINQSFKDFELIIIDDCSTDGSQDILKNYVVDPRVKLFLLEKNTGSYVYSSNLGASKASAEYIIFAQCDDYAEKTQLDKLFRFSQIYPQIGVIFSSSEFVDKKGRSLGSDFNSREKRFKRHCCKDTIIPGSLMSKFLLHSCVIPNLSAALIKRSLFEKLKGLSPNYFVLADWDFWLKMSLECDFFYIRECLNNFRQHETTIRETIKLKRQINELFEMYYCFFSLSKIHFLKQIKSEFRITSIWISYFWNDKITWLKSMIPLFSIAFKYKSYLPIILLINLLLYPFTVINILVKKMIRKIDKENNGKLSKIPI